MGKTNKKLSLHKVLKNSYASKDKQKTALDSYGYTYDPELSNDNQQVYYNKSKNKLLYSIAGTHNLSDVGTDAYLAVGHLKDTNRYKNSEETLKKAKKKYGVDKATIAGHSLGGSIGQYVGSANDTVLTLDKGATIGQKGRSNEKAYRTSGDAVSLMNANSKNMTTLKNPKKTTFLGTLFNSGVVGLVKNAFQSHDVDNIQDSGINIDDNDKPSIPITTRDVFPRAYDKDPNDNLLNNS